MEPKLWTLALAAILALSACAEGTMGRTGGGSFGGPGVGADVDEEDNLETENE